MSASGSKKVVIAALLGNLGIAIAKMHVGPQDVIVAMKVAFDPSLSMKEIEALINELEREVRAKLPRMTKIFIEPDSEGIVPTPSTTEVA